MSVDLEWSYKFNFNNNKWSGNFKKRVPQRITTFLLEVNYRRPWRGCLDKWLLGSDISTSWDYAGHSDDKKCEQRLAPWRPRCSVGTKANRDLVFKASSLWFFFRTPFSRRGGMRTQIKYINHCNQLRAGIIKLREGGFAYVSALPEVYWNKLFPKIYII